jgi:hypothetical protein
MRRNHVFGGNPAEGRICFENLRDRLRVGKMSEEQSPGFVRR